MITIKGTIREEPLDDDDDWYDTWDGDIDTMRVGISRPPIRKPYPRDAPKSFDLTYDENEGWSNAQDMLVVMINRWLNSSHKVKDQFTNKLVPATLTGEEHIVAATVDFMLTKKGWSDDYVITLPEIEDSEKGCVLQETPLLGSELKRAIEIASTHHMAPPTYKELAREKRRLRLQGILERMRIRLRGVLERMRTQTQRRARRATHLEAQIKSLQLTDAAATILGEELRGEEKEDIEEKIAAARRELRLMRRDEEEFDEEEKTRK